jgi:hypothetical protein
MPKLQKNDQTHWMKDRVQFARLLAEIRAVGLTKQQYLDLQASMDCTRAVIEELLFRAEDAWEHIKETGR